MTTKDGADMPGIVEPPRVVQDAVKEFGDLFGCEPARRHFAEYLLSRPASLGRNQKLAHPAEASPGHHSDGQVLAHVG